MLIIWIPEKLWGWRGQWRKSSYGCHSIALRDFTWAAKKLFSTYCMHPIRRFVWDNWLQAQTHKLCKIKRKVGIRRELVRCALASWTRQGHKYRVFTNFSGLLCTLWKEMWKKIKYRQIGLYKQMFFTSSCCVCVFFLYSFLFIAVSIRQLFYSFWYISKQAKYAVPMVHSHGLIIQSNQICLHSTRYIIKVKCCMLLVIWKNIMKKNNAERKNSTENVRTMYFFSARMEFGQWMLTFSISLARAFFCLFVFHQNIRIFT